jgi:hypothetical protein
MLEFLGTAIFTLIVWSPVIIGIALIRSMG